jgi:hypothetical protein
MRNACNKVFTPSLVAHSSGWRYFTSPRWAWREMEKNVLSLQFRDKCVDRMRQCCRFVNWNKMTAAGHDPQS